ncbi:Membrane insertion protein OxaA/YidC with tetratricopeptide repeat domain [Euphorbia peplus]|nr:Membrane insertion protein OxaA/YidC with tetratricopeptide repeat domain [Euphorbia peplus]
MAIPKLIFSHLRRSRRLYCHARASYFLTNPNLFNQQSAGSIGPPSAVFHFPSSRSFWSPSKSNPEPKLTDFGENAAVEESILPVLVSSGNVGEDSFLPVRTLISLLDGFHNLTGLPWWAVIASTTLVMRLSLMPLLVFQLKKLQRLSELFPRLPPPLPPPFSGESYINQFLLFNRKRRAIGCPSFLWNFAYVSVQVPFFLLWVTSIRRMSLHHHAGFDCGGTLWFQNLTELPHGVVGPIFPMLIAALHFTNVQLPFKDFSAKDAAGILGLLAKNYKMFLNIVTIPIFCIAYCVPQGSLVYWATNSSLNVIQHLFIKHPAVREKLGLPDKQSSTAAAPSPSMVESEATLLDSQDKEVKFSAESLSPEQLFDLSRQLLSQQQIESAVLLLRVALQKDPDFTEAMVYLGWALLRKGLHVEATEHLERAIPKLYLAGESKEVKNRLILASQWAGVACIQQGKKEEAILHLERVAHMGEPENPTSKVHYFDTLVFLAGVLNTMGRKPEAIKYLELTAAYNPSYKKYLNECVAKDDFGEDLANSRR